MKRKILMFGFATLTLFACNKELVEDAKPTSQQAKGFNPKYEDIKPLILAFKEAAELSNYGTSKTTSMTDKTLAEAEWTLEGALNYDHAHPVQLYEGMHVDSLTITVNNNGTNSNGETMVDGDDLAQAYANLLTAINNLVPTGEDVEVIDVVAISHNNMFTTFKAFVSSGQPLTLVPDYVKPDDDWRAGLGLGKCDGTQSNLDATDRIDQILNFNIANNFTMNLANPQQVLFYTNISSVSFTGRWYQGAPVDLSEWFGQDNDPYHSGVINGPPPFNTCLNDLEMQHYVAQVWQSVSLVRPINKDIIRVDVGIARWSVSTSGLHHLEDATFGVPVL